MENTKSKPRLGLALCKGIGFIMQGLGGIILCLAIYPVIFSFPNPVIWLVSGWALVLCVIMAAGGTLLLERRAPLARWLIFWISAALFFGFMLILHFC